MKSINLLPPKHPDRQMRTWIAMLLIVALAVGALAGIYYYVDSINGESQRYLTEAVEVERQTSLFLERAEPRENMDKMEQLSRFVEQLKSERKQWEDSLLDLLVPLPGTADVYSINNSVDNALRITMEFDDYVSAVTYMERLEQLPQVLSVNVVNFYESKNEISEEVPVLDSEGNVLYHETSYTEHLTYYVEMQLEWAEGEIAR